MNLNEIWAGNDYAWYEWKGRNEPFRSGAPRVKAIRAYKEDNSYRQRATGMVEVMMMDEEGNPKSNSNGDHIIKQVRARDIAMRWDEYVEEREYRRVQAEKIERERDERAAEENRVRMQLTVALTEKYGIPKEAIYNVTPSGVHLSRSVLEKELGLVSGE